MNISGDNSTVLGIWFISEKGFGAPVKDVNELNKFCKIFNLSAIISYSEKLFVVGKEFGVDLKLFKVFVVFIFVDIRLLLILSFKLLVLLLLFKLFDGK